MLVFLCGALKVMDLPLIVLIIVGLQVWKRIKRTPQVRNIVDPLKLKMPILQSLDIVAETTGNVVLERATRAVESVRTGESLSQPLTEHPVFLRWWCR